LNVGSASILDESGVIIGFATSTPAIAPLEPHSRKFLFVNSKVGFLISGEKSKNRFAQS
jgi:hypothetical protein